MKRRRKISNRVFSQVSCPVVRKSSNNAMSTSKHGHDRKGNAGL